MVTARIGEIIYQQFFSVARLLLVPYLITETIFWDIYLIFLSAPFFTITAEIHARSLVNFYCQYADMYRHMNWKFIRRVRERERAIAKRTKSKNRMQITELPARLSEHKRVLREIQGI